MIAQDVCDRLRFADITGKGFEKEATQAVIILGEMKELVSKDVGLSGRPVLADLTRVGSVAESSQFRFKAVAALFHGL